MTAGNALASMMDDVGSTQFTGYGGLQAQGRIVALLRDGKPVDEAEEGGPSQSNPSLSDIPWCCTSSPLGASSGIPPCPREWYNGANHTMYACRCSQSLQAGGAGSALVMGQSS